MKQSSRQTPRDEATVLIIEDDPPSARMLQFLLENDGLRTRVATDGRTALASYMKETPDVVLMNLVMPDADGFEIHHRLRSLGYRGPVAFVTARPDAWQIIRRRGADVAACLVKPFYPDDVVRMVRSLVRTNRKTLRPTA
ncbi:MAG TPA: response regulator [Chloroflexota bacterium]|nr:response regulator [Chloroflexota bacterium]